MTRPLLYDSGLREMRVGKGRRHNQNAMLFRGRNPEIPILVAVAEHAVLDDDDRIVGAMIDRAIKVHLDAAGRGDAGRRREACCGRSQG